MTNGSCSLTRLLSIALRLCLALSTVLFACRALVHSYQSPADHISPADRTQIIEAVLDAELRYQTLIPEGIIRTVSSENIEFMEPSRLWERGFTKETYSPSQAWNREVRYLAVRRMTFRDDVAVVVLSRVSEIRPCWTKPLVKERRYTYEVQRTSTGWAAKLKRTPENLIPLPTP